MVCVQGLRSKGFLLVYVIRFIYSWQGIALLRSLRTFKGSRFGARCLGRIDIPESPPSRTYKISSASGTRSSIALKTLRSHTVSPKSQKLTRNPEPRNAHPQTHTKHDPSLKSPAPGAEAQRSRIGRRDGRLGQGRFRV